MGAVASLQHRVAIVAQRAGEDAPNGGLVLREKNGLPPAPRRYRPRRGRLRRRQARHREMDAEARPRAWLAGDGDEPPALVDDAVDRGQAEAGPFPDHLRGVERLEDVGQRLGIHPGAGIGRDEHDVHAWRRNLDAAGGRLPRIDPHGGGLERQRPAIRHRVARVQREVEQHLVELSRVGVDQWQILGQPELDPGDLPQRPLQDRPPSPALRR